MRVSSSMYYDNLYGSNNSKLSKKLFDVNKQISSGLKIQYAYDDVASFVETMKLDNEMAALGQIKKSTESGKKISNQTDVILNEFETTMVRTRTLLVQASNASQSVTSMDAIAAELRGIESHFKNLSNTSINGQFLFSGSAINTKPINDDGVYMGNDKSLDSFLGSNVKQAYNLNGAELFLGEENLVQRKITTNMVQYSQAAKYPDYADPSVEGVDTVITTQDSIENLMGNLNTNPLNPSTNHFYISGTKNDGSSFKEHIQMTGSESVGDLLTRIGNAFGNSPSSDVVNVTLNDNGQIIVEDKQSGSSKLDFHMVGAVDFDQDDGNDAADVHDGMYGTPGLISNLENGETNFDKMINTTSTVGNTDLYVKRFVESPYDTPALIDGIVYDQTQFTKDGAKVSSNTPQVLKLDNSFATDATKLSEVADITKGTLDTSDDTLDGTQFVLNGTDMFGSNYSVTVDLATAGSTFTVGGTTYDIYSASTPRAAVDADDMTYRQLMDVVNMVVTNNIPAGGSTAQYDQAIYDSKFVGETNLSYDGKIEFEDKNSTNTKVSISLYDASSGDFTLTVDKDGVGGVDSAQSSALTFNSNNALTINDPKTDFFKTLDSVISAVEEHKLYPDSETGTNRNVGMENAIAMLDELQLHLSRSHASVGANSNTLKASFERASLLEISTMTLRSSVIDTDVAEASLELAQLNLNYQAMLSTVSKVSQLSLVNYL